MTADAILEVRRLSKTFGGVRAVNDVSFSLGCGEIVGMIGPNGAGKTTLVNLMTGVLQPTSGIVLFDGIDVTRQKPHQAARRGLARTFQIVQPFPEMTVLENVAAAALFAAGAESVWAAREQAREHLEFVGIGKLATVLSRSLTLPDRKRLELAKGLAMRPRVLMLDEVNAGLNSGEIDAALDLIRRVSARGVTIIIVEHLMKVIFSLSDRVLVLHQGALISQGKPAEVAEDENVIRAYLGSRFAERHKGLLRHG
jgi:branched-chain amino acid transport system ATP-binding protein